MTNLGRITPSFLITFIHAFLISANIKPNCIINYGDSLNEVNFWASGFSYSFSKEKEGVLCIKRKDGEIEKDIKPENKVTLYCNLFLTFDFNQLRTFLINFINI